MSSDAAIHPLTVVPITAEGFAPFGDLIGPTEDGVPFGAGDATLDLSRGVPRFYIMRLDERPPLVRRVTRHRRVTQCLAAVGGEEWVIAVAPPGDVEDDAAEPDLASIKAFAVPGDVAIKLHRGTWHAGPYFAGKELAFFNLELSDTNESDHQDSHLDRRFGVVLRLEP